MKHTIEYYRKIQGTYGVNSAKEARVRASRQAIRNAFHKSLNWENVIVNGCEERTFLVIPTDDVYTKKIKAHPDTEFCLGDIVRWADTRWIVNAIDADSQLNHQGTMVQCNICLRWQLDDGTIHEEYGWDKDASKYSYGETRTIHMDVPQFTMKAIFQINEYTLSIRRNKRFLLGLHAQGENPLAVEVSRINSITNTYKFDCGNRNQNTGLIEITIHETQFNPETDNIELGVANYREVHKDDDGFCVPETPPSREDPLDPVNNEEGEWF